MMRVKMWGTRGSLPTPGGATTRYGGNTSCVQVEDGAGATLILDAGTGIRELGMQLPQTASQIHVLLTHLHLDHILGLGFFAPLFTSGFEVHIWGPAGMTISLEENLKRYLSPPLFPLHLLEMSNTLRLHEIACDDFQIGAFHVCASLVCHPGPTIGYRLEHASGGILAYIPDHEPALGIQSFPQSPDWTSGYDLAQGADLLIHDAQYTGHEYEDKQGWGHSTVEQALLFGGLAEVRRLATFHYDPAHDDAEIDRLIAAAVATVKPRFEITPGVEGAAFTVG